MRAYARLALAVTTLQLGCGGAEPPRVTSPFTEEDGRLFDGSIDFVREPAALEGRWYDDWMTETIARVRSADAIARVTVTTLRTDTDLERRVTYRLQGSVDDMILGRGLSELSVRVREDEAGFDSITANEGRVLNVSFVVYVKWYQENPSSEVVARWHMSPATRDVLNQVTAALAQRNAEQTASGTRH